MKRNILKFMACVLIFSVILLNLSICNYHVNAATFDDINQSSVFLKGGTYSSDCVLTACAMMLRRTALATGNANWNSITTTTLKPSACVSGTVKVYYSFSYAGISVAHTTLPGGSNNTDRLISVLSSHPEGIVLYNNGWPHAVLLTDYTNGTFYCADPDLGPNYGRVPISQAYKNKVTIGNADEYWYVSSPTVSLTLPYHNPEGCVDDISGGTGSVYVRGWAFDRDNMQDSLYLLVHIDDQYAGTVLANVSRTDVDDVYHVGQFHGYEASIQTDKTGSHEVKIYALNIGGGDNVEIAHETVYITPADTTLPIISDVVVSNVNKSGFTVTCTVTDDTGIKSVSMPTWSDYNGQDDIIWHSAAVNGNIATCEIKTSDHNNENGLYIIHIYAYDNYGNGVSVGTGVIVPDSYVSSHYYNGHIYEVYDKSMTWSQAKSYCEERGGYLLAIEDADEQAFITQILSGRSIYAYAIGGTDEKSEGVWEWVNGKPVTYTNWSGTQPDNSGNEDHMWIYADSTKDNFCKWNDYPGADWNIGFICEIETENYTPTASVSYNGFTYELYNYNLTYYGAEEFCKSKGGHLASITSAEEQSVIYEMYKNSNANDFCWIGAKRTSQFGDFIWEDSSQFIYSNWYEGEPNNQYNTENAAEIYKSSGQWNDAQSYACCDTPTRKSCFILKKYCPAEGEEIESGLYTFKIVNGTATITKCKKSASGSINIPSELSGFTVTGIGENAFYDCDDINEISIPNSVVSIGNQAFSSIDNLTSVSMPDSVLSIGDDVFSWCHMLESINLPKHITRLGHGIFFDCHRLSDVIIPYGVTSIGGQAFGCCYALESIDIPNSVKEIEFCAFENCTFTSINIPASVSIIACDAFSACENILSISVSPDNNRYSSINNCLIDTDTKTLILGCRTSIIPDDGSVINIGEESFYRCTGLSCITIPDSIVKIGRSAFNSCLWIQSVNIPNSLCLIEKGAFMNCKSLTDVYYGGTKTQTAALSIDNLGNDELLNATWHYSHKPGDINGDDAVNNKDLTRLFQYLSEWDVEVNEYALDVNGDGKLNNKDLTRLFQYLSEWDVEIY